MSGAGSSRRFRVESLETTVDGLLDPGAAVARHLRVLRLESGEIVQLFDGRGTEMRAELVSIEGASARLRLLEPVERDVESPLEICLIQAIPVRSARMETIVRQTTELGVGRIVPVLARHSPPAKGKPASMRRKAERWQRVADAAAEQSGRTRVPRVDVPIRIEDLSWEALPRPLLVATPTAPVDAAPTPRLVGEVGVVTVMIGPEGGWAPAEVERARSEGAVDLWLGPRVLRADSAGVVAITLLQYLSGDLGERLPARS